MEGLLETIQEVVGCFYLSDLHSYISKQQLLSIMEKLKLEQYSLNEWSGACSYIFEQGEAKLKFKTYQELIDYLSKKEEQEE